ncbi:type II secretion system major pseudopilin GspG [Rheinheimera baltica]|uniref:Type II secretion system core protein G n=1 Tax=Rheinheimera baltica TaxID=67576 RepID=A0ABT9HVS5_9GAMM|nr:type II secretion system major pseudopilin GspG [Rheinheimera baltica]MDP5134925.1 type II secretion system major pseudopilin GspG [Rheinheimera baltica]MDP5149824.1 type II secretion system major pseudopilin GspG [Rheinheimera baltica]
MNSFLIKRNVGFTLIELLIVMVILGLLASLVAPTMFSKVDSSKKDTAAAQMQMLATSLDAYRLDVGKYPASLEELRRSDVRGWDGPYIPRDIPLDPWGNSYVYRAPGEDKPYNLMSLGADGRDGGEDNDADIIFE